MTKFRVTRYYKFRTEIEVYRDNKKEAEGVLIDQQELEKQMWLSLELISTQIKELKGK